MIVLINKGGKMSDLIVWLTINRNCNLRCKWCYQRDVAQTTKTMDYELALKLIDLSFGLQAKEIILIGGEPTLHPRFFDIIKNIKLKGLRTNVVSNSIKFADDKFINKAVESGLASITTSIKGSSKEEYIDSTGCDAFDLLKKAMVNIRKSKIIHQTSVTVSNSVVENWGQMIDFIKENNTDNYIFSFEKPTLLPSAITFDEKMFPKNISRFIQDVMYPSLVATGVNFKMELMFQQCVLGDGFVNKLENDRHAFGGCLLMKCDRRIVFDPEGFVLPCNHFVTYPIGKYGEDFNNPPEFVSWKKSEEIKKFYQVTKSAPGEKCANCDKWSKCGAGCRLYWLYSGADKLLPSNI